MMTEQQTEDLQLLLHAMMTANEGHAQYTLPQGAMLEFARLVRAAERERSVKLLSDALWLFSDLELTDFGRLQLSKNLTQDAEALREEIAAYLARVKAESPPAEGQK